MSVAFEMQPGEGGTRYDGPHGPITLSGDQAPDSVWLDTPQGRATLAYGMRSDEDALREGVSAQIGGQNLTLRRDGRALVLGDGSRPVAVVRRKGRSGVVVEAPDGAARARFKTSKMAGEVEDGAEPVHVTLMLLIMGSGAARTLDRKVPLLW
jgi:hypothetical protein